MGHNMRRWSAALTIGAFLLAAMPAQAATNDRLAADFGGFGTGGVVDAPLQIADLALAADGAIIAAGSTNNTIAVARFQPDGTPDTRFGNNGLVTATVRATQLTASAAGVVVQPDGKIVVAGDVINSDKTSDFAAVRFTAAGALDPEFGSGGVVTVDALGTDDRATALALTRDNRLVIAGYGPRDQTYDFAAVRLTSAGALDTSFGNGGKQYVEFGQHERARTMLVDSDDRVVLFGDSTQITNGVAQLALARLLPSGTLDLDFGIEGRKLIGTSHASIGRSIAQDGNGRLLITGDAIGQGFVTARLTDRGRLDPTFDDDGVAGEFLGGTQRGARAVLPVSFGNTLVVGYGDGELTLVRYTNSGDLDGSFGTGGRRRVAGFTPNADPIGLVQTRDGQLILASGTQLVRLFSDGTLDAGGRLIAPELPITKGRRSASTSALLVQPAGQLVSVGTYYEDDIGTDLLVTRHTAAGRPDLTFGTASTLRLGQLDRNEAGAAALLDREGRIVIAGSGETTNRERSTLLVSRLSADGTPDPSCGAGGITTHDLGESLQIRSVALQADGKLLVAGLTNSKQAQSFLARLGSDCQLDKSFAAGGVRFLAYGEQIAAVLALADGKLLLTGSAENTIWLARFAPDGSPDPSFGVDGRVRYQIGRGAYATSAALGANQQILVGASVSETNSRYPAVVRFNLDGTPDPGFGKAGVASPKLAAEDFLLGLTVRADGLIAVVGCPGREQESSVALLNNSGAPVKPFGTDGGTTLAIGDYGCLTAARFNGTRLYVGGNAYNDVEERMVLAAYELGPAACCAPNSVRFSRSSLTVAEPAGRANLAVQLSQTSSLTATVHYSVSGGTATNGQDYRLGEGDLVFAPGQTVQQIPVTLNDDERKEGDETVVVVLSKPTGVTLGEPAQLTMTITDDETPPRKLTRIPLVRR